MKAPLLLITIPMVIIFLTGMLEWYMDDEVYMLFGFSMIIGVIWAWLVESRS